MTKTRSVADTANDGSIPGSRITDLSLEGTKITNSAVEASKIADGAITDEKVSALLPIDSGKIQFTSNETDSVSRTVESRLEDILNAKDFGVGGNGTNDTAAFAKSLAASAGKVLFIPPGSYLVDSLDIPQDTTIIAKGAVFTNAISSGFPNSNSFIRVAEGCEIDGLSISMTANNAYDLHIVGDNVTVKNCTLIDTVGSSHIVRIGNNLSGIRFVNNIVYGKDNQYSIRNGTGISDSLFSENYVDGGEDAFLLTAATRCVISNNTCLNTRKTTIIVTSGSGKSEDVVIEGNIVLGDGLTEFGIQAYDGSQRIAIIGNTVKDCDFGGINTFDNAILGDGLIIIANNVVENCAGHGIKIRGQNYTNISNNAVSNSGTSGIILDSMKQGNVVIGNQIYWDSPAGKVGIKTQSSNRPVFYMYGNTTNAETPLDVATNTPWLGADSEGGMRAQSLLVSTYTRLSPLNAAPSSPETGTVYYDNSSNKLRCWNGSSWNDLF